MNTVDYAWTSVATAALGVELYLYVTERPPVRWRDPILFDNAVRDALVLDENTTTHAVVATASWSIFLGSMAYPFVVDVPVAWAKGGSKLAYQFLWQDLLVLTTTASVDLAIRELTGRVRPRESKCLDAGGTEEACLDNKESTRSFPNGHFAVGSAMAALLCVQHLNTRLYGGPADAITCGTALAANVSMGFMRIMVDKHWATDTIVGGALGALGGWLLPTLLYYRNGPDPIPTDANGKTARTSSPPPKLPPIIPMPLVTTGGLGLSLTTIL